MLRFHLIYQLCSNKVLILYVSQVSFEIAQCSIDARAIISKTSILMFLINDIQHVGCIFVPHT